MHQQEHRRLRAIARQRLQALAVRLDVLREVARLDVEHVDEHADVREDRRALRVEERVHEGVLPAAVPEVEDQVPEEPDMVLLDVDRRAESRRQ